MNLMENAKLDQEWQTAIHNPACKPVLEALVTTIREAHRIKPSSWALSLTQSGWAVVAVSNAAVMTLRPGHGGDFLLAGSIDDFSSLNESIPGTVVEWRSDISKARISDDERWLEVLDQYHQRHVDAVRELASWVKTNVHGWPDHARPFVVALRAAGYEVPDPQYVQSGWNRPDWVMVPAPSGYWRIGFASERELRESAEVGMLSIPDTAEIGDLLAFTHDSEDLNATLIQQLGASSAEELMWLFQDMKIGDRTVANHGATSTASGVIVGDYEYKTGKHSRAVEWNEPISITGFGAAADQVIKRPRANGLTPITESFFQHLVSAQELPKQQQEEAEISTIDSLSAHIAQHFSSRGLTYTNTQIAEFYTVLQTKGFVVLSGISGTGKSKIAQHFTEMFPDAVVQEVMGPDPVSTDEGLNFRISKSENWSAVGAEQSGRFPRVPTNTKFDVRFVFEGGAYNGSYKLRILAGGRPTLYFTLGHALTQKLRDSSGETGTVYAQFMPAATDASLPEVRLTTSKPDRVEGQVYEEIDLPNTLFLSVRPDWRDGTSLLGYYNPLTQTYEWTDFLRFVINATDNMNSGNPVAWFVILDEMNLAHVEYYFADLLSVLESGRDSRGFTTEPIRLTYPDTVVSDTPPTEIFLPPNLYIIGTVNMDETTHAFSPKVLDRAFTMELSDVDFLDYQPGRVTDPTESSATDKDAMLSAFTMNGWPGIDKSRISQYIDQHPEIRMALHELNAQLARNRFHFGYRVFDEIVQFLANAEANTMFSSMEDAFDSAVFMKILPKFSGSEGQVGAPLHVLHSWVQAPFGAGSPPLARTLDRVTFMLKRLEEDGFVTAF